jgi:hypothetical protein
MSAIATSASAWPGASWAYVGNVTTDTVIDAQIVSYDDIWWINSSNALKHNDTTIMAQVKKHRIAGDYRAFITTSNIAYRYQISTNSLAQINPAGVVAKEIQVNSSGQVAFVSSDGYIYVSSNGGAPTKWTSLTGVTAISLGAGFNGLYALTSNGNLQAIDLGLGTWTVRKTNVARILRRSGSAIFYQPINSDTVYAYDHSAGTTSSIGSICPAGNVAKDLAYDQYEATSFCNSQLRMYDHIM